jgi:multisubunit Na+/H+ antiporter MnhG subunit
MKLPDVYRDWRAMLGMSLILLGAGNWIVGEFRTEQYSRIIAATRNTSADQAYRSFDELEAGADAVLEPFTDAQRRVSYATARMDFYHATFLTGRALVAAGLIVTLFGFLGLIRSDARRAFGRIDARARGPMPPAS